MLIKNATMRNFNQTDGKNFLQIGEFYFQKGSIDAPSMLLHCFFPNACSLSKESMPRKILWSEKGGESAHNA